VRTVRVNQVADIVPDVAPVEVKRRALMREVAISANTFGRSVGEVSKDIKQIVEGINLPPGYSFEFGGSTKNMGESFGYALSALMLAIVFIYMVLASQFKSFLQPVALMSALPLTLIGVVVVLLLFGSNLSMFTVIGIIMLMGLATKNAILLVDYAIRLQEEGIPRETALLEAAKVRLRPILMTTVSLVLGMVPLAFALTEGSEQRAPMGQAVIGGVITSSVLTLIVVPVIYCYMDDFGKWIARRVRKAA
jgi:HAE1 family hydrophobic/amphiphilic exporter-1